MTDASLRRSLRKLAEFRALGAGELEAVLARMERREFRRGGIPWHGARAIGIVAQGEASLERRHRGQVVRSRRLAAGDVFEAASGGDGRSASLCVRALTDGVLYILPRAPDQVDGAPRAVLSLRRGAWALLVVLAVLALTWQDLSRILAGAVFLAADRADGQTAQYLDYASWLDPRAAFAYNRAGALDLQAGRLQEAQADFLRSLRVESGNAPALNNLAVTYFSLGQGPQAVEAQRSAALREPDRAVVQYNLGEILLGRGEEREALSAFRQAALIAPEWALPHVQMGCLYLRWLDHARAEQEARAALSLDPRQGAAHLILAIALFHQGRLPEAQTALADTLELDPAQPVARFYQALTLNALGQTEAALSLLEQLHGEAGDPLAATRVQTEIEALQRSLQDRALQADQERRPGP